MSYATTGKSISDHAVSAVNERDCAMHRIALGEQICTAPDDFDFAEEKPAKPADRLRDSMIALAENLEGDLQPASGADDTAPPLDTALLAMADALNAIDRQTPPADSAGNGDGKHYLVIGQYRALHEAEKVRERHASLRTKVRMVLQDGALLYQVTAGPFSRPAAEELEAKLDTVGTGARVALLCADGVTPAPCGDGDPSRIALSQRRN